MNYESSQWQEIQSHLETDGIGVLHIWFGDAGSALTMLNEMQEKSKQFQTNVGQDQALEYK